LSEPIFKLLEINVDFSIHWLGFLVQDAVVTPTPVANAPTADSANDDFINFIFFIFFAFYYMFFLFFMK
jgi:hypothetical protein